MLPCKMDRMQGVRFPLRERESEDRRNKTPVPACSDGLRAVSQEECVQQTATCKPARQHRGRWSTLKSHISYSGSDWTRITLVHEPGGSYLYDVMCVLFSPVPATQLHPSSQWAPSRARLCAKQVILWVEVMGDSQAYLSWDKAVHVPVNCHTMNVPSCVYIIKDLEGQGGGRLESFT